MRSKLFIALLMAALAIPMANAQKFTNPSRVQKTTTSNVVKQKAVTANPIGMTKLFNAPQPKVRVNRAEPVPAGYARVTLEAHDVWQDGSGYQMLFDADSAAIGSFVPETGPLTSSGDVEQWIYDAFEYKIPENADGALTTSNIVYDGAVSILIPAGMYDYVITNPTPGDRMWIASDGGDVPGRYDNAYFNDGYDYVFTVSLDSSTGNDRVDLVVEVPGQARTMPENVSVVPGSTDALVSWDDEDDMYWIIRWREVVEGAQTESYFWDFETEDWLSEGWYVIDADGDGFNWSIYDIDGAKCHSGGTCLASASWSSSAGALTPENWIITPIKPLSGSFSFWYIGQDASWAAETFRVYMYLGSEEDFENATTADFVEISNGLITASSEYQQFVYDLSSYEGQQGCFAIVHCEVSDMFMLNIDDICIGDPNVASVAAPWTTYEYVLTDTNFTIPDLTPETNYEVQVAAYTTAGYQSQWTESTYFTTLGVTPPAGKRGDANGDDEVNISDVIVLINAILSNNFDAINGDNSDVNYDTEVNITDVIQLINFVSSGHWYDEQ